MSSHISGFRQWCWHYYEIYVTVNDKTCYLWRAADHEGEIFKGFVTKKRDNAAALNFMKKSLKRNGSTEAMVAGECERT